MGLGKYFIYLCFTLVSSCREETHMGFFVQGGPGAWDRLSSFLRGFLWSAPLSCASALIPNCSWQPSCAPKIHHSFPTCCNSLPSLPLPQPPRSPVYFLSLSFALRWRHTGHSLEYHEEDKIKLLFASCKTFHEIQIVSFYRQWEAMNLYICTSAKLIR